MQHVCGLGDLLHAICLQYLQHDQQLAPLDVLASIGQRGPVFVLVQRQRVVIERARRQLRRHFFAADQSDAADSVVVDKSNVRGGGSQFCTLDDGLVMSLGVFLPQRWQHHVAARNQQRIHFLNRFEFLPGDLLFEWTSSDRVFGSNRKRCWFNLRRSRSLFLEVISR